ncbi:MAG: hypothetical protein VCC20_01795 [Myxococcota bacterium]
MTQTSRNDDDKARTAAAVAPPGAARKWRRGGRKRRKRSAQPGPASEALAKKTPDIDLQKSTDEPLSPHEVSSMRDHFHFLRAHRKVLRLKVNAAEDLLLNGVQAPTHRGVCQHLLGKVDRRAVISACERLEAEAAVKLLAGIILFSADIEYVLLLLEKIQLSASPDRATAALAQGLERIDFDAVSSAQMRRVLSLIAEVYSERERPEILLGLLESRGFRGAFDQSIDGLPAPLASLVVPLRALQAVILHGKPNTYEPRDLSRGIGLLLGGSERSLRRRSADVRERLFRHGLQACHSPEHTHHRALTTLLSSFYKQDRQHGDAGMALALHLLAAGHDDEARTLLKQLSRDHPAFKLPNRWLERVQSPNRIGRFAIEEAEPERRDAIGHHVRRSGHWIDTMQIAWIQIGSKEHVETMTSAASVLFDVCIPNLVPLLDSGMTREGAPYFVTPHPGQSLEALLREDRGVELDEAIRLCLDGSRMFGALISAGVELRDGKLGRFAQAAGGALWLVDVSGACRTSPAEAAEHNLSAAREFCESVLRIGTRYLPPRELLAEIERAESCSGLVRSLARSSRLGPALRSKRGSRRTR